MEGRGHHLAGLGPHPDRKDHRLKDASHEIQKRNPKEIRRIKKIEEFVEIRSVVDVV